MERNNTPKYEGGSLLKQQQMPFDDMAKPSSFLSFYMTTRKHHLGAFFLLKTGKQQLAWFPFQKKL